MTTTKGSKTGAVLWTVQGVLAALFLFAGGVKLTMSTAVLAAQTHLPAAFMYCIGVAEISGALGLVLPGLFRIRTGLTPLAAAGLVLVMIGATTVTVAAGYGVTAAILPFAVGGLCALVAGGRWRRGPLAAARRLGASPPA